MYLWPLHWVHCGVQEGEKEGENHSAVNIDGDGDPRAADRQPVHFVHDHHVQFGVIDLDDRKGVIGTGKIQHGGGVFLAGGASAEPTSDSFVVRNVGDTIADRVGVRRLSA